MKIKRFNFHLLRNYAHFQCNTEFKNLVEKFDAETLKIKALYEDNYLPLYKDEDEAIIKIIKNSFTEARMEVDTKRNLAFRGMIDLYKSTLNHYDPVKVSAAKLLKIVFDTYGNVARLPLKEKSSAIYNLLQELNDNFSTEMDTIDLTARADILQNYNIEYETLVKKGYEEEAAKTELCMSEVRIKIDKVVRRIIQRIEALILIEGEENYDEFVRRLNVQFEKYANTIAQRKGMNAKEDEVEDDDEILQLQSV